MLPPCNRHWGSAGEFIKLNSLQPTRSVRQNENMLNSSNVADEYYLHLSRSGIYSYICLCIELIKSFECTKWSNALDSFIVHFRVQHVSLCSMCQNVRICCFACVHTLLGIVIYHSTQCEARWEEAADREWTGSERRSDEHRQHSQHDKVANIVCIYLFFVVVYHVSVFFVVIVVRTKKRSIYISIEMHCIFRISCLSLFFNDFVGYNSFGLHSFQYEYAYA